MVSNEDEISEKEKELKQIYEQIGQLEQEKIKTIRNLKGKDLEKFVCKTYVCPDINQIDVKGKELGLSEDTIDLARNIATKYLKKTYHKPNFSIKYLVPAFLYIASSLIKEFSPQDFRTQKEVAKVCKCSEVTVRKRTREIKNELNIKD